MGLFLSAEHGMKPPFDIAGDLDTPVSAYAKLAAFQPRFLLESVEGGERLGRYSFIGFGEALEVRLDERSFSIGARKLSVPRSAAELLAGLRQALAAAPRPLPELGSVPLAGGLVGYTAYDIVRYFERLPEHAARLPNAPPLLHYVAPRSLLVFDHLTRAIALLHAGSEVERAALRRDVILALRGPMPGRAAHGASYAPPAAALSREAFLSGVRRAQEYIAAGDVYQLVLSSRFSGRHDLDPFQAYRALRLVNPSPYMFYCELGDLTVVGSSPEALVRLYGGQAELRPIAGTRPRSGDPERDAEQAAELLADPKENAEHVMLVDLARNDLGRVARAGTVRVEPFRALERYSHVMHIVSGVHGRLASGCDAFDLFAATFPAGTLVGAPKVRAMEIIEELEPLRRGVYGGAVLYADYAGNLDSCIAIRTMFMKGKKAYLQAGAGIVADSVPKREYEESVNKASAVLKAVEMARGGE